MAEPGNAGYRTLWVPKTSSAQVGASRREFAVFRFPAVPWLVPPPGHGCCGKMICCAAPAGLPECDERVRVTAAAAGKRPRQGHRDPGAAPFDTVLKDAGIETVLSGVQMPRMNSIMKRWVQTRRHELLTSTDE
jgi:hypothetical protein